MTPTIKDCADCASIASALDEATCALFCARTRELQAGRNPYDNKAADIAAYLKARDGLEMTYNAHLFSAHSEKERQTIYPMPEPTPAPES